VLEAIARARRTLGTTTVLITHNASIGGMADRVVHFADGRIAGMRVNDSPLEPAELSW
jgi:putative ABC transport system ATP-binding protein